MTRITKTEKILILKPYGKYLGYKEMKFTIRSKEKTTYITSANFSHLETCRDVKLY